MTTTRPFADATKRLVLCAIERDTATSQGGGEYITLHLYRARDLETQLEPPPSPVCTIVLSEFEGEGNFTSEIVQLGDLPTHTSIVLGTVLTALGQHFEITATDHPEERFPFLRPPTFPLAFDF